MTAESKTARRARVPPLQSLVIPLFVALTVVVIGSFAGNLAALPKDGTVAFSPLPGSLVTSCPAHGCDTSKWWFNAYYGLFTFPGSAISAQIYWKASANVLFFAIPPIQCGRIWLGNVSFLDFCSIGYFAPPSTSSSPPVICLSMGNEGACQFSPTTPSNQNWSFEVLSHVPVGSDFNFSFEGTYNVLAPNSPW